MRPKAGRSVVRCAAWIPVIAIAVVALVLGAALGTPRALTALIGFVVGVLAAAWAIGWARARRSAARTPEQIKLLRRKLEQYDLSRDDSTDQQRWPM